VYYDNRYDTKVFFYAVYDNPEDAPAFGDVFRVHADLGYVADIDDTEYTDIMLAPGRHAFTVDQLNWAGDTVSTATMMAEVRPGQPLFIEEHVLTDGKAALVDVDSARGLQDIRKRTRACPCDDGFLGL
jgi:hypothetical protein